MIKILLPPCIFLPTALFEVFWSFRWSGSAVCFVTHAWVCVYLAFVPRYTTGILQSILAPRIGRHIELTLRHNLSLNKKKLTEVHTAMSLVFSVVPSTCTTGQRSIVYDFAWDWHPRYIALQAWIPSHRRRSSCRNYAAVLLGRRKTLERFVTNLELCTVSGLVSLYAKHQANLHGDKTFVKEMPCTSAVSSHMSGRQYTNL